MGTCDDIIDKARASASNLRFAEAVKLAECLGFTLRSVKGSHHVYTRPGYRLIINLQQWKSGEAKPRQVEQMLKIYDDLRREK